MSNLFNRSPKDSYQELLTLDNTGAGVDSTLRAVMDGSGVSTPLKLSSTTIALNNLSWPTATPTQGQVLTVDSGSALSWQTPAATGVTSVGLTAGSNKVSVSGSPITSTGSITVDVNEGNLTLSNLAGTLATTHGGTGLTTIGTAGQILRVNAGATGLEWAAQNAGSVTSVNLTAGSSKITVSGGPITSSGSITVDVAESVLNIANMTGTLGYTRGGTGLTSLGTAGQAIRVNAGATGFEFYTPTTAPVTSVAGRTGDIVLTTTDVTEGTRLYYTDARARASISVTGSGISYNSSTGVITSSAATEQPSPFLFLGC